MAGRCQAFLDYLLWKDIVRIVCETLNKNELSSATAFIEQFKAFMYKIHIKIKNKK
jgi:hypothetical protein